MADIFLTNTLSRTKEKFGPIKKGQAGIYTCGPTVYRDIHIGNFRTYLMADILRRVLIYNGYKVKHVKNITDVGHMRTDERAGIVVDPVIAEALKQGKTPQEIAETYTKKFFEDEKRLNILPANVYPKATEHVQEMIELTKTLLNKGYAYETDGTVLDAEVGAKREKAGIRSETEHKSFGTIYFNVKKFANYGKLSGNTLNKMDKLLKAVRVATETDKKDSADFALWKKAEKGRTLKWPSPWGEGFPGWHIECSAMSMKYLGQTFDLHTGGEDNIFPHHEDEIAQSEAATGKKFVNYWLHGGFLLVDGKKMAKREGNVYTISDLAGHGHNPLSFRYLVLTAHYRSRLNFTGKALAAAENALNNLYREISLYAGESEAKIAPLRQGFEGQGCAEYESRFLESINNDMDMPSALSVVWELVRSDYPPGAKLKSLYKFDQVLGLDFERRALEATKIPAEIKELMSKREEARKQNDFEAADKIRKEIKALGYEVVDTKSGQKLKKII